MEKVIKIAKVIFQSLFYQKVFCLGFEVFVEGKISFDVKVSKLGKLFEY